MFRIQNTIYRLHKNVNSHEHFIFSNALKQSYLNLPQFKLHQQHTLVTRNFCNWKTLINKSSRIPIFGNNCTSHQFLWIRPSIFQFFKKFSTDRLSYNIKVENNVMLYKYENPWMFKISVVCAVLVFLGSLSMIDNVYLILCKDLFHEDKNLLTRLREHIFPLSLIAVGVLSCPVVLFVIWYVTKRSVKYIVLHKGSTKASIVTYHPIKGEHKITVPLSEISCTVSRLDKRSCVYIKIRNNKFNYMIEKAGSFVNPELFDATIGTHRF
ncbi:PREDICTED: transmembrane protein 223-like [Ceratosolen solmsi marchali]|uniref:Transmembrane protein 223-like n=1 Tax=Ceratosolen solmsi marchali TaxID=326594 RepID=A0AAJ7E1N0_9HYME|nr:PREDICTED: transmembrane protein 223-like [Ceratosolen solmsi marchali]